MTDRTPIDWTDEDLDRLSDVDAGDVDAAAALVRQSGGPAGGIVDAEAE